MPTRSPTRLSTWASRHEQQHDQDADHQRFPDQRRNESESLGHHCSPWSRFAVRGVSLMQCGHWRGAIVANRGKAFVNMLACPSPSSTSTAPSRIATRCFRWCCASSRSHGRCGCCGCSSVLPAAVRFAFDRDRAALKQSLLRATLRGTPRAELHAAAAAFVTDTIARRCFADALAAIRRHRDAGSSPGADVGERRFLRAGVRPPARLRPGHFHGRRAGTATCSTAR